jgi:hypothetical protein
MSDKSDDLFVILEDIPVAVEKEQIAVEKEQIAVEKAPIAVEKEPVAVEKEPVAVEKEPVAVEKEPVAVEKAPIAVEKAPIAVEKAPIVVEKEQIAVKELISYFEKCLDDSIKIEKENINIIQMDEKEKTPEQIIMSVLEELKNQKIKLENDSKYENSIEEVMNIYSNKNITPKNISEIYKKFNIQPLKNEKIDLVYLYIDYNDIHYSKKIKDEIETKDILHKIDMNKTIQRMIRAEIKRERTRNYDFFINLEKTCQSVKGIGNIYIITPTPFILNGTLDSKIKIVPLHNLISNEFYELYIYPSDILRFINKIDGLSELFFFGNSSQFICNPLKKMNVFNKDIPITHLTSKNLEEIKKKTIKNFKEYNAVQQFYEKFGILMNYSCVDKISLIRKDVINMTNIIFENKIDVDYKLLQYLVGGAFKLYEIDKMENQRISGFLSDCPKNPYEKLSMIKFGMFDYFTLNGIHENYIPYYAYGMISKNEIHYVYIMGDTLRYSAFDFMKKIGDNVINKTIKYIDKVETDIFDESIYVVVGGGREKYNIVNSVVIEINEKILEKSIPDILYFMNVNITQFKKFQNGGYNISEKYLNGYIKIHYPHSVIKKLEKETKIPYFKILNMKPEEEVKNNSVKYECVRDEEELL